MFSFPSLPLSVSRTLLRSSVLRRTWILLLTASAVLLWGSAQQSVAQTPSATIENTDGETRLQLNYDGGLYVPGIFSQTTAADSIPATGPGTRLMWYPAKAAFRAGRLTGADQGDAWNPDSVGVHSVAMGVDTRASGPGTVALGRGATAASTAREFARAGAFVVLADTNVDGAQKVCDELNRELSGTVAVAMK